MENSHNKIVQPLANRVYGIIMYWLSIVAAVICIFAPVLSVAFPENNVLDPQFLFSTIWEGAKPDTVWQAANSGFPGGHFWMNHMTYGDGITQFGIVLGGCCAGVALFGTAIAYLKQKPKSYGWALLSIIISMMVFLAAIGIYRQVE
jgi:hypothetical protein